MAALNSKKLPAFIVEGKTHVVGLRTDQNLTRLVEEGTERHSYLVQSPSAPRLDAATRAALALLQRKAVNRALDEFVIQIARQLKENPKVGYLVKVNRSAALEGTVALK